MKLLIVDDSMIMRSAIQRSAVLDEIHEIHTAENGQRAIELFEEHQPELVTMDLTMPMLDGLEAIGQITQRNPRTAILVISALNSHQTAMEAISQGACGFLVKPFTPDEVREAMGDLVQHARDLRESAGAEPERA